MKLTYFSHSDLPNVPTHGGRTFGEDFDRVVAPLIKSFAKRDNTDREVLFSSVRTANMLPKEAQKTYDQAFLIIHSFPTKVTVKAYERYILGLTAHLPGTPVHFFCHYKALADFINSRTDYTASFVPMTVDIHRLPSREDPVEENGRWIYFGNVTTKKRALLSQLKELLPELDVLSFGYLNGDVRKKYTQQECWELVQNYSYGIGVGRSFIEMSAMGIPCLIAGERFGGVIMDDFDLTVQHRANFNGRLVTGDCNIPMAITLREQESFVPEILFFNMNHVARDYANIFVSVLGIFEKRS